MLHPETHLVTKENGPRPAGSPDKCFYCGEATAEDEAPWKFAEPIGEVRQVEA